MRSNLYKLVVTLYTASKFPDSKSESNSQGLFLKIYSSLKMLNNYFYDLTKKEGSTKIEA
jgi:hypothetical protein